MPLKTFRVFLKGTFSFLANKFHSEASGRPSEVQGGHMLSPCSSEDLFLVMTERSLRRSCCQLGIHRYSNLQMLSQWLRRAHCSFVLLICTIQDFCCFATQYYLTIFQGVLNRSLVSNSLLLLQSLLLSFKPCFQALNIVLIFCPGFQKTFQQLNLQKYIHICCILIQTFTSHTSTSVLGNLFFHSAH